VLNSLNLIHFNTHFTTRNRITQKTFTKKARREEDIHKLIYEARKQASEASEASEAKKEADKLKRVKELAQKDNKIYKVTDFIGPFPPDYFDRYGQEMLYDESDFMEVPSRETDLHKLRKYSDIFKEDRKIYEILLSSRQK
jgi:hypothetical protein